MVIYMKKIKLGTTNLEVPAIISGCMRLSSLSKKELNQYLHTSIENGINYFDHADIYASGKSEDLFGEVLKKDSTLKREQMIIQSKCGIRDGFYDQSSDYIISSVDGILKRLQIEYLDVLLIHRPDALVQPEEVAKAFDKLENSGKVRHFGVSNHKPMQIELLKKYVSQYLIINQLQFSLTTANMVTNGIEVNMHTDGGIERDGSVLDYCRLNDVTIQTWSPFQMPDWKGTFIGNDSYTKLNEVLEKMANKYSFTKTAIAAAWILRHPANMQIIAGTTNKERLNEIVTACDIQLSREDWYELYLSSGNQLP
ncbi:aldo/keto reductase [Romboutsia sp.]|uniref:aldo/keto reductase n=1 Tax=Romboutsia sp. TaxID=1965302 RepID=UPI003F398D17